MRFKTERSRSWEVTYPKGLVLCDLNGRRQIVEIRFRSVHVRSKRARVNRHDDDLERGVMKRFVSKFIVTLVVERSVVAYVQASICPPRGSESKRRFVDKNTSAVVFRAHECRTERANPRRGDTVENVKTGSVRDGHPCTVGNVHSGDDHHPHSCFPARS